jgi:hypothetical protein
MKITYANQTIDLNPPKEIILSLSGGLDSSSLAYLILKHFPETIIWPICGQDVNAPFDGYKAKEIIDILREEFPDNKLMDLHIYEFNDRDPEIQKVAQKMLDEGTHNLCSENILGVSKALQTEKGNRDFMKIHPGLPLYDGLTQNPPVQAQKEYGMYEKAIRTRDPGQPRKSTMMTRPYVNVDKKFVAGVYFENNLMNKMFPYTGSCVGTLETTNGFTEPCKQCFWCKEKYWAFGEY